MGFSIGGGEEVPTWIRSCRLRAATAMRAGPGGKIGSRNVNDGGARAGAVFRADEDREYFFSEGCHILEVLNTPDDPGCSIVRARVAPGVTTAWHRLRDTWERYVILDGQGAVFVGGNPAQAVGAGDVVLIPPMARQRICNTGSGDLVFLAVCTPRFTAGNYLAGD